MTEQNTAPAIRGQVEIRLERIPSIGYLISMESKLDYSPFGVAVLMQPAYARRLAIDLLRAAEQCEEKSKELEK